MATKRAKAVSRAAVKAARTQDLSKFYRFKAPPVTPGDFEFMLDLLRPGKPALPLDRMVDSLSWDDEQSVLTGNLSAYRPDFTDPTTLPIARGQQVRCRVKWAGGTFVLWTMRTKAPQTELDTGNVSIDLQDDMALLDTGKRDWWFRKTKSRPHGYTCDEIATQVAHTLGVRIDKLAAGTTRVEVKLRKTSGLAVIKAAYDKERAASGRSFILRLVNGRLAVTPLARNPMLYVLEKQIQTALITQKAGPGRVTTVLKGRGHVGKGKGAKTVTYSASDRKVIALLGRVEDTKDFGRVDSPADLRGQVNRELANRLRLNDTISIQHQGIPFILRGDATMVNLPREGYGGKQAFVFCTRANHTVSQGTYTTTWDFTAKDPYVAALQAEAKAVKARAKKRSQRPRSKLKARARRA